MKYLYFKNLITNIYKITNNKAIDDDNNEINDIPDQLWSGKESEVDIDHYYNKI